MNLKTCLKPNAPNKPFVIGRERLLLIDGVNTTKTTLDPREFCGHRVRCEVSECCGHAVDWEVSEFCGHRVDWEVS